MKLIKICHVNDLVLGPLNFQTWPGRSHQNMAAGETERGK